MKILILGGQGFIGQNLCMKLLEEGHDVLVVGKHINPKRKLASVTYYEGDFTDVTSYQEHLKGVDVLYHLISTTNANDSNLEMARDIKQNVLGTIALLDICVEEKVKKVIFTSSGGTVYGIPESVPISESHPKNPICSYGISKLTVEKYLHLYHHLYGLDYTVLRLSNPYGPFHQSMTQGLINVILQKTLLKEPITIWGDGKVERDYIYIEDAVEALSLAKEKTTEEKVFNIGSGKSHSICDIINEVESTLGEKIIRVYKEGRNQDVPVNVLDITLAKQVLGWEPKTDLHTGIIKTYASLLDIPVARDEEVTKFEKRKK